MKATILCVVLVIFVGCEGLFLDCNPALIDCFRDPCTGAICPSDTSATCRTGCQCQAEWYDISGQKITGCFNKG